MVGRDSSVPTSTRELLDQLLCGKSGAEVRLWELFHPMLVRRAERHGLMKMVRKIATAEDVANEVWLRVYSRQSFESFEYRGRGSLAGFLGTVLDNTMRDWVRRVSARRRTDLVARDPVGFDREAAGDEGPPSPTSAARAGELLELCRRSLDEREWEIFRLKELEGYSSIEIGERLGIPGSSVRRIHADALTTLRRELG